MTTWREAFFQQAIDENKIRLLLCKERVAYSHQLHYLQMVSEKVAKGFLSQFDEHNPPRSSHIAFVALLQILRRLAADYAGVLGYRMTPKRFAEHIKGLLPLAHSIQSLAPSIGTGPNPEYPWETDDGNVIAPVAHDFSHLEPNSRRMKDLIELIHQLLRYGANSAT